MGGRRWWDWQLGWWESSAEEATVEKEVGRGGGGEGLQRVVRRGRRRGWKLRRKRQPRRLPSGVAAVATTEWRMAEWRRDLGRGGEGGCRGGGGAGRGGEEAGGEGE